MGWARFGSALLLSNAAMMLLGYLILRLQAVTPINPQRARRAIAGRRSTPPCRFITNTNWQAYSGETSLSNFSQMAVITHLSDVRRRHLRRGCGGRFHCRGLTIQFRAISVTSGSTSPARCTA